MINLVVCVMHASFIPERVQTRKVLVSRIGAQVHVVEDNVGVGPWPVARRCWELGIESGASHIVVMNDDALPCTNFYEVAKAAVSARPDDILSFYTNHTIAQKTDHHWYSSVDGLVGVACCLPAKVAREFLEFIDTNYKSPPKSDDRALNVFAMSTSRLVWTTVPSLVDHQLPDTSTVSGNESHVFRRPAVLPTENMTEIDWTPSEEDPFGGRVYQGTHWDLITQTRPERWESLGALKAFDIERTSTNLDVK